MADNFLENQYEEYQARKAEREAKKKALWRKRLKAYQESLKKNPGDKEEPTSSQYRDIEKACLNEARFFYISKIYRSFLS